MSRRRRAQPLDEVAERTGFPLGGNGGRAIAEQLLVDFVDCYSGVRLELAEQFRIDVLHRFALQFARFAHRSRTIF